MNDSALKNFCTWARVELINGVEAQMVRYGITAPVPEPAGSQAINGLPLSPLEVEQRDELLRLQAAEGHDALRDRAAYTWFNRIVAMRFMEARGWLPSRMRMLSRADGSHGSEAVENALDVEISTADPERVAELKMAGSDEPLWRYLFVAQSEELADCLPGMFERVGGAMELLLPQGLMMADGVVGKLNATLADEDWLEGVTVLGWMYQYYNADVKDEFFKSKRKAAAADIAPSTQLFTPEWIVRYMVENSLGRLWMLNNPGSSLRERMEYYIEPDEEHEDFIRISSPEEITLCDPACGSGHILVYAFELLFAMYEERGYRERDTPELILTNNLAGMEIDPRAAQIAELALAMCAREHDRRFFRRGVRADVTVLTSIPLGEDELPGDKKLAEELSHLGEIGSLLNPTDAEIERLKTAAADCAGDLFAAATKAKLENAVAICEKLSRRFTCTVANPPYMGSSSFNPFMSKWVKKNYPDVKSDLCTCFIERIIDLCEASGFAGITTSNSWMFLSSFEKLRNKIIEENTIDSLIQLSVHGFHGIAAQVCTFVLRGSHVAGYRGGYIRLNDFDHWSLQEGKTLEAIQNPTCGWFYRRNADTFKQIPGTPIAYWASDAMIEAFGGHSIRDEAFAGIGMRTGDNARFLRLWHEVGLSDMVTGCCSAEEQINSGARWVPYNKGGNFRRWYGNNDYVVNWFNNGEEIKANTKAVYPELGDDLGWKISNERFYFKPGLTWTGVTSGLFNCRLYHQGFIFDSGANGLFSTKELGVSYLSALLNSSVAASAFSFLNPTLNFGAGTVNNMPVIRPSASDYSIVEDLAHRCFDASEADYNSFETSWDFSHNPLV